ncbi:MAG TPA: surface-adhesin E family protein, partial [Steroidobacteraceae bacterium]|nr:surface-adhesin E family protein [Steroidobacteraceae bacterium]
MNPTYHRLLAAALAGVCLLQSAICAAQTPEQQKMWEAQHAQAQADEKAKSEKLAAQRAARKADPMGWVRTLDPLTAGGWQFRSVAPDGSWASFSTEHQLKRSGKLVTAWLRQEYPEPQRSNNGNVYLSYVEKIQYDCANERARALLLIYYSDNNIMGSEESEATDVKEAVWVPIVPGTPGENVYQWACADGRGKTHS